MWDGLSYLLAAAGADSVGDWYDHEFLAMGDGAWVSMWTTDEVAEAAVELGKISTEQLLSHFDGPAMTAADTYPSRDLGGR